MIKYTKQILNITIALTFSIAIVREMGIQEWYGYVVLCTTTLPFTLRAVQMVVED